MQSSHNLLKHNIAPLYKPKHQNFVMTIAVGIQDERKVIIICSHEYKYNVAWKSKPSSDPQPNVAMRKDL